MSPPGKPYETTITPGWTIIDLDGLFEVSSANVMLQRNDIWYQYEIWSSLDGENWTKLGEKKTENLPNEKEDTYTFEAETYARYIKLQTTNIQVDPNYNNGNNGRYNYNVNELQVFGSQVVLDKTELEVLIAVAEGKKAADYTEDSWTVLTEVLNAAKEVAAKTETELLPEDISNAVEALNEAISGLTMKPAEKTEYTVTVDGEEVKTGKYNTKIVLTAEDRENKVFVGWMVNDKIISIDKEYVFYLANDIAFIKIYADKAETVTVEPEAVLSGVISMEHAADIKKINARFVGQLVLPDDCKILEAGLVWASDDDTVLDIDHAKVTRINKISDTKQFSVTINGMPQGRFVRGRVFATIQTGDQEPQTVYSVTGKITNTK